MPLRSRKRKQEEESDGEDDIDKEVDDDNEYASSDDEDLPSDFDVSDDDDDDEFIESDERPLPRVRYEGKDGYADLSLHQSVDGDKIFRLSWWSGRNLLSWAARRSIINGQNDLLFSKQRKRSIILERVFGRSSTLSQVPYRKLTVFIYFIVLMLQYSFGINSLLTT